MRKVKPAKVKPAKEPMTEGDVMGALNISDSDWDVLPDAIRAALVKGAEGRRDLARALEAAKVALNNLGMAAIGCLNAAEHDAKRAYDVGSLGTAQSHKEAAERWRKLYQEALTARDEAAAVLVNAVGKGWP